ncbi:MAG: class I SAM-dependent methyltransferase [Acidimicrobiales bacterium]
MREPTFSRTGAPGALASVLGIDDRGLRPLRLRALDGRLLSADTDRWLEDARPEEERLLDLAVGPVLDVGCGPGRHLVALRARGVMAVGVDITPAAVRLARGRGAWVLEGSVFENLPGPGLWGSALLLDGNIGIGADPVALLSRLAVLLRPSGRALVELDAPAVTDAVDRIRLEHHHETGPWFNWTRLAVTSVRKVADASGFSVDRTWREAGRWFARLDRR